LTSNSQIPSILSLSQEVGTQKHKVKGSKMKTKIIVLTLAGLGLTTALMASGPQGDWGGSRGDHRGQGMHQKGEHQWGMHHRNRIEQQKHQGKRKGFMRRMGRELDLTQEQRKQIRQVFKDMHKAKQAEHKMYKSNERKRSGIFGSNNPESFMSADNFDKEAFKRNVLEQQAKRKAMRQAKRQEQLDRRADMMEKIFQILTPEQRLKWIQLSKGK
jgi:Spy/CpxP family protein refolding chaperone